ncbi:unnamed protein product (macronuclear) [Paramecium tetraurelia]|uniref:Uncharacterized protein n=1 Tax=Paramecium tetraurelia TaxID=5888 RepID=A0BNM3_PARTE|nr:uncharacterized protein GSPATT00030778001 [Paramecium tetraurelia]CAK60140.1 unnamed protein product [Paramecium tetraurelia]|eukprot:XP_001427538.1 hypothetical protein (macronuclear) [Paramecium tetraurelia strain d4-2]
MNVEERPGTSFTSKRQVQTEQRKRQQMNLGTLETEDKSVRTGMKIRPITQDQQRNSLQQKRQKMIPQAILYDRESLYEEVINAKQINNNLQRENQALHTKIKMMDEELQRLVRATPISEQVINPMESFYQDSKPMKQHLIMDLKKQLRRLQEEQIKKDQQIQFLQKNTKAMKIKELEIELLSYQQEAQRLKALVGMKFNDSDNDLLRLRADYKLLEDELKQLKVKCKEFESKATMYYNEKLKKDKLNQYLKNQIENLKFKDPEYKKQNKITENEQQLKQDIDQKQVQIDTLISSLKAKDAQYAELDKRMKELEREQQQIIDQLERERQQLREQCNSLKEEVSMQSGRRRTVQNNSFLENKLEVLPEGPEIIDQKKKLLPCVTKDDVNLICKQIKFKLKAMKVPFEKIDNFIHGDVHSVIRIEELNEMLQDEPFLLNEVDSLKVARYLIEDNDERFVEFSLLTEGLIARAKSILKNLIGKYTLLEKNEEDQLFLEMAIVLSKYRNSLEDFILRSKKKQELCTIDDLEEALKFVEQTFNSTQYEYLLLKNYELTQQLININYKKIFELFYVDPSIQQKTKSESDLPKEQGKKQSNGDVLQNKDVQQELIQQQQRKQKEEEEQRILWQLQQEQERQRQLELEKEEEEQRRLEQQWKEEEEERKRQEEEQRIKQENEAKRQKQLEEMKKQEEQENHRRQQEQQRQQELLRKQKEEEERQRKLKEEEEERRLQEEQLEKQKLEEEQKRVEQEYEQQAEYEQNEQEDNAEEYNDQQFDQQQSEQQNSVPQNKSQKDYEDEDFEQ